MNALARSIGAVAFYGALWIVIFITICAIAAPIGLAILLVIAAVAGAIT